MKSSLHSFEIHKVVEELQFLTDSKLSKFYQPEKKEILFQLHKTGYGKVLLKIFAGGVLFLTEFKKENKVMKDSFGLTVRKLLSNSILREIKQLGFERIVEFTFETKEKRYYLIVELFSKGNAVITDEGHKIISCIERQVWKDRAVKPKETYTHPKKDFNFLELTEENLKKVIKNSKKENLVKTLAMDLGLGGLYAEEVCLVAGVDKKKKELDDKEVKKLFKAVEKLRAAKISPLVIKEKDKIIDVVPVDLEYYKSFDKEKRESFNKALDDIYTKEEIIEIKKEKTGKKTKEIDRIKNTINIQENKFKGFKNSAEENQRKGEIIYENYKLIEDLLNQIKEARKTMSWKEIKKKLKENKKVSKIIKKIDEAKGEVTIDI